MDIALDPSALMPLLAAMLAAGLASGMLAGLLGVGGGIVSVPVMFTAFSIIGIPEAVRMHIAVATSLAAIVPTAFVSARSHHARGAVDGALLRRWAPVMFLGACLGVAIAGMVRGPVLSAVFAAGALGVALYMLWQAEPEEDTPMRLPPAPVQAGLAGTIGTVSAMMGIGGGTFSVPVLRAFAYPIRRAVGTAAAFGMVIAVPAAIGYVIAGLGAAGRPPLSLGYVSLPGLALLVPMTTLAAPWGARLAHAIRPELLRRAFALFLLLTALKMASSLI